MASMHTAIHIKNVNANTILDLNGIVLILYNLQSKHCNMLQDADLLCHSMKIILCCVTPPRVAEGQGAAPARGARPPKPNWPGSSRSHQMSFWPQHQHTGQFAGIYISWHSANMKLLSQVIIHLFVADLGDHFRKIWNTGTKV